MESTEQRELSTYGTTIEGLNEFVKNHVGRDKTFTTLTDAALSILSDSQEEIELGGKASGLDFALIQRANRGINRAKWLLDRARFEGTKIKWLRGDNGFVSVVEGAKLEARVVRRDFPDCNTWEVRAEGKKWKDVGSLPKFFSLRRGFEHGIETAPRW